MVLSGIAADAVSADRAVQVAKSLSGANEVVNAMQVAPPQQVMLEVRFLEATRDAGRKLGVNWFGANAAGTRGVNTGLGSIAVDPRGNSGRIPGFLGCGHAGRQRHGSAVRYNSFQHYQSKRRHRRCSRDGVGRKGFRSPGLPSQTWSRYPGIKRNFSPAANFLFRLRRRPSRVPRRR